jgi:DNA (cytosine-5)-methyltransferase 1
MTIVTNRNSGNQCISTLTAVSLFAGAGGMDLGFARAGFDISLAVEIDKSACATYRLNHRGRVLQADLRRLSVKDYVNAGHLHALFGGPPCQGFSIGGNMKSDDARNMLIDRFFDCVEELAPHAFVCENVPALANLKRWGKVREALIARADKKYETALLLLNAADFGVPQNRHRMFLVGIRKDIQVNADASLSERLYSALGEHQKSALTVGDIVRALGPAGSPTNARTCGAKITYLKNPVLRSSAYAGMIFNGAGRPLRIDGPSNTLPATMGGNRTPIVDEDEVFAGKTSFVEDYHRNLITGGRPCTGKVPRRLRRLTIDECIAIQGFPADYRFFGSKSAIYRQIGNAVPPPLAEAVARAVHQILHENHANQWSAAA